MYVSNKMIFGSIENRDGFEAAFYNLIGSRQITYYFYVLNMNYVYSLYFNIDKHLYVADTVDAN